MKWLTNTDKYGASTTIARLCRGHVGRNLVTGEPQATERFTSGQLQAMGIVGIYERATAA